jgi:hypothetical protein
VADYCHHAAARIDLQFDFHLQHFGTSKDRLPCFSYANLYPEFEIWGYQIESSKQGDGWIYLNNVTKNGLGIYTRKRLPWGSSLPEFNIKVQTPPIYQPKVNYRISRYSYQQETFVIEEIVADSSGKLTISSAGGIGEEIGILGRGLQPPVFILTDTVNETIYLNSGIERNLALEVINLSTTAQKVEFKVNTENTDQLTVLTQPKAVMVPAQSKIKIDSFCLVRGNPADPRNNTACLRISSFIGGQQQDREQIIQIKIGDKGFLSEASAMKIFDGRSEELSLFKYAWNGWRDPLSVETISEGLGDGDGVPEAGEIFSIWIQSGDPFDSTITQTWHPIVPVYEGGQQDFRLLDMRFHSFSTGRDVISAQIQLTRNPTKDHPVSIPFQTEILRVQPLVDDCHRDATDDFTFFYGEILIHDDGTCTLVGVE